MKSFVIKAVLIFFAIIFLFLSTGCEIRISSESADVFFKNNKDNIIYIINYLDQMDESDVFISGPNDDILADLCLKHINDNKFLKAIKDLWDNGCSKISKIKYYNSICFELLRTNNETRGLLVKIDNEEEASAQSLYQLNPISDQNCFYYVCNYEKCRYQYING